MEWGELAVNYNADDPALFTKVDVGDGSDGVIVRLGGSGALEQTKLLFLILLQQLQSILI